MLKYSLFYKDQEHFIGTYNFPLEIKVGDIIYNPMSFQQKLVVSKREFDLEATTIDLYLMEIENYERN